MSEKTEQPTAKRLKESREKGEVAYSKDFTQTLLIVAIFGYFLADSARIVESLSRMLLLPAGLMHLGFHDAANALIDGLLREMAALLLPILGIVLAVGVLGDALQVGLVLAFKKLKPSAQKLNVLENAKNIFSKKNLVESLKSIVKITLLSALLWHLLRDALPTLVDIPDQGLMGLSAALGALIKTMLIYIALAYSVIALADFVWQRMHYRKGLMMSKDEVQREYKEMEGDPHIKQQRKQLHQEMLQNNAVASARKATVIVTNPTHVAVALQYDEAQTPLPLVLAMGEGALAARMVQAAREAGVPVMQNIPLARALLADGQEGQYIPSDLVAPVAELLRLLQRLEAGEGGG